VSDFIKTEIQAHWTHVMILKGGRPGVAPTSVKMKNLSSIDKEKSGVA
jgi:hypothetical protein